MNKSHKNPYKNRLNQSDKQYKLNQQIDSMLVSRICHENHLSAIYLDSHRQNNKNKQLKFNQSMIKKENSNNIFIQEGIESQYSRHNCQQKCIQYSKNIQKLNENVQLIFLKIRQIQSKIDISFSKHAQSSSKLIQQQKIHEQIKFLGWQSKQKLTDIYSKIQTQKNYDMTKYNRIQTQIQSLKKIVNRYQQKRQNERTCLQSQRVEQKMQRMRTETQERINQVIYALGQMGKLQRKMVEKRLICSNTKVIFPEQYQVKGKSRVFSVRDKPYAKTNQSTNISFSRNYQTMK